MLVCPLLYKGAEGVLCLRPMCEHWGGKQVRVCWLDVWLNSVRNTHTHKHTHAYTHAHAHAHTHTHTHTHTIHTHT